MKYYYIYKVTNLINNKYYVGCHQTNNIEDNYMGSGKLLKQAFKKYGVENFKKEIIKFCKNKKEMFKEESKIVNTDFVNNPNTYNMVIGGAGGFKYDAKKTFWRNEETKKKHCASPWFIK